MKQFYVVYKNNQTIRGPMTELEAKNLAEDLDMALCNPNFKVIDEKHYHRLMGQEGFWANLWHKIHPDHDYRHKLN